MPKINIPEGNVWKKFKLRTDRITPNVISFELKPSLQKDKTKSFLKGIKITKEQIEAGELKEEEIEGMVTEQQKASAIDSQVNHAIMLIVDWDLTNQEDKKFPCTEDNKKFILDEKGLIWELVIPEETEEEETEEKTKTKEKYLFSEIINFCSDIKNFSKN